MREYFLDGATTSQGFPVSIPREPLRDFARILQTIPPDKDFWDPTNKFVSAWQRFAGEEYEYPRMSAIGNTQMECDLQENNKDDVPSQTYYFEFLHSDGDIITGLETGVVGDEFMKTKDYGKSDKDRIVEVIEGNGIILVQKNASSSNGETIPNVVEDFKIKHVKRGERYKVPKGYYYALANPDNNSILVVKHSGRRNTSNNQALVGMRGLAFYVTEIIGRAVLEKNPKYSVVRKNIDSGGLDMLPFLEKATELSGWSQD